MNIKIYNMMRKNNKEYHLFLLIHIKIHHILVLELQNIKSQTSVQNKILNLDLQRQH